MLAVAVVPLVLLAGFEILLRLGGYGYDPGFFRKLRIGGERFYVQNDEFSFRFFPRQTVRHPGALRMRAVKPPGTVRIFVLGESAAMGDPEPAYGPARYMEVLLRQRHPDTDFEVVNVAFTAINSHVILPIARECARHDGDVWILYMGNNEMVGPYGASSAFGRQAPPLASIRASLWLQRFRLGQLVRDWAGRWRDGDSNLASWGGMPMFLDNQVSPQSPARSVVQAHFRQNLEDIMRLGLDANARILLCSVAVNLGDCPPFASLPSPDLSAAERERLEGLLREARAALAGDRPDVAADRCAAAAAVDSDFAALQYEWGTALARQTNMPEARRRFQAACDADTLAFRTTSGLNDAIREVAETWPGTGLRWVDTVAELERDAETPFLGSETFHEHVHFKFEGGYRLGLVWAREVESVLAGRLSTAPGRGWATRGECDGLLGLTPWNRVLVLRSMMNRLGDPPLSTQPNNPERVRDLQLEISEWESGCTEDAAARARETFPIALALTPDEPLLYEVQGNFLQAAGDLAAATEAWRRAEQLIPHDFLPAFQLGVLLSRQDRAAEAERCLRRALAIRPSLVEGWAELGRLLATHQDWEGAVEAFRAAATLQPRDARLWAYQARALAEMGLSEQAVDCYRKAIELRPDFWQAHGALAALYVGGGRLEEATAECRAVLQIHPDDVTARLNLGTLLLRQGDAGAAVREYEEVLRIDPGNENARAVLEQLRARGVPGRIVTP